MSERFNEEPQRQLELDARRAHELEIPGRGVTESNSWRAIDRHEELLGEVDRKVVEAFTAEEAYYKLTGEEAPWLTEEDNIKGE